MKNKLLVVLAAFAFLAAAPQAEAGNTARNVNKIVRQTRDGWNGAKNVVRVVRTVVRNLTR